jgi:hypothetical protein
MTINYSSSDIVFPTNFVFIDSQIKDYQSLLQGLKANSKAFILNSDQDGITQITNIISLYQNVSNIHLIAHGIPGKLYLGNTQLSLDTLTFYQDQLKTWFKSSDINSPQLLIYGCQVALGDAGAEFLEQLQGITHSHVYASTTLVGNEKKGGNWDFDVNYGNFEQNDLKPALAFSKDVLDSYSGVFASTGSNENYVFYDSTDSSGKGVVAFVDIGATGTKLIPIYYFKLEQGIKTGKRW